MRWSRIPAAAAGVVAAACLCTCATGASVDLTLDKASGVPALETITVVVRELTSDQPTVYGPIKLRDQERFRFQADIPPGSQFYLDVHGCSDFEQCQGDLILARGCTDVLTLEQGERRSVNIILYPSRGEADLEPDSGRSLPARGCPPAGPHTRPPS